MSQIPKSRSHLLNLINDNFKKLEEELIDIDSKSSQLKCDEDFNIKDIIAIRLWWSEAVNDWIVSGQKGRAPIIPAEGYSWRDTPELNRKTAEYFKKTSYKELIKKLKASNKKILKTISSLTDEELTSVGVFEWAGEKWPVMRWVSVGTSSQYAGARKLIRKAKKSVK